MKERPILFSGAMVRALLAGTKTQTRRMVKPQPVAENGCWMWAKGKHHRFGTMGRPVPHEALALCQYGQPGDRLWVRETFQRFTDDGEILYKADPAGFETMNELKRDECLEARWRPAIHMPRYASRITLEITGVRVERLHDISESDALAEGVTADRYVGLDRAAARAYSDLWEEINGPGSWEANPWLWVVEFRRVGEQPAQSMREEG